MADGQERTFGEFGWNASQTAAVQRAKVQDALDSGEPLRAPVDTSDIVKTDEPLEMKYTTSLVGNNASYFHSDDPDADILWLRCEHPRVQDIQFTGSGQRNGSAIRVGPQVNNDFVRYALLENLHTDYSHRYGVLASKFGGLSIEKGGYAGREAGIRWENEAVDTGDSRIVGADINASNSGGYGLDWVSGGGLYITQNKFNQGYGHIRVTNMLGQTGSINIHDNSFEGNVNIAIDFSGNQLLKRVMVVDNNFGVLGCAVAVRNFNPAGGAPVPWLEGLIISDNLVEGGFNGAPLMDIGCASNPVIKLARMQGQGNPTPNGIIVRPQCSGGILDTRDAIFTGITTPVYTTGSGITVKS